MPFLPPNQQRQSNEGKSTKGIIIINEYYYSAMKSKKLQEHLTAEKKIKSTTYTHTLTQVPSSQAFTENSPFYAMFLRFSHLSSSESG